MGETLPWKIIFIGAIFSLVVLGIAFYFITPQGSDFFTEEKTDRIAEFKSVRVAGRREGKRVWELFAKEGWSSKDREVTYLSEVSGGKIYQDGNLVVTGLNAPKAKAYRRSEMIEVFGPLKGYLNLGRISKPSEQNKGEWTEMSSNYLKYTPKIKVSEIKERVKFTRNDSTIFAETIVVDHEKRTARTREGPVRLEIKEGHFLTTVKCQKATFYAKRDKEILLTGSVHVSQQEKEAKSDEAVYDDMQKVLVLTGNASLKKNNDWIRAKKVIVSVKDETFEALEEVEAELNI